MTDTPTELTRKLSDAVGKMPIFPIECGVDSQHQLPTQGTGHGHRERPVMTVKLLRLLADLGGLQVRLAQKGAEIVI